MKTLVYRYGLRPPTENGDLVIAQLRLAHEYRCDLAHIERGRRDVLRALERTPVVAEAESVVRAATRSTRMHALQSLGIARREAREALANERAAIDELDHHLRKSAYNHYGDLGLAWGTRLRVMAAADAARAVIPKPKRRGYHVYDALGWYQEDGLDRRGPHVPRWTGEGELAVQIQQGEAVSEILRGRDTRVRISVPATHGATISLRVGSDGRAPIWATWPLTYGRRLPDGARMKWACVTARNELRDHGMVLVWSCELTLEIDGPAPRSLDRDLAGTIAVEACWDQPRDGLIVARWRDDSGRNGVVELPPRIVGALRKAAHIQSIRDGLLQGDPESHLPGARDRVARLLKEDRDPKPPWLAHAAGAMPHWKSPTQMHDLARRWRAERCDAARPAYEALQEWELRDWHLWTYQANSRRTALRSRLDLYGCLAARWAREYRHAIIDDRALDREARWGDASDLRFQAGPGELRQCIRQAFGAVVERGAIVGGDVTEHPVREEASEDDDRDWCERAIDAWTAGGARKWETTRRDERMRSNAFAARKRKKAERIAREATAREPDRNTAE